MVFTAKHGEEAIVLAKKEVPHLIVMDIMMPVMDGVEACRMMRTIPALNKTIMAFLTARSEDYSRIAGLDFGTDDYIQKPIKLPDWHSSPAKFFRVKTYSAGCGVMTL